MRWEPSLTTTDRPGELIGPAPADLNLFGGRRILDLNFLLLTLFFGDGGGGWESLLGLLPLVSFFITV